jgi:hypothetical protein
VIPMFVCFFPRKGITVYLDFIGAGFGSCNTSGCFVG